MPSRLLRDLLKAEIEDMEEVSEERHRKSDFLDDRKGVKNQTNDSPEEAGAGGVEGSPSRPHLTEEEAE